MNRRDFLRGAAATLLAPIPADAQQAGPIVPPPRPVARRWFVSAHFYPWYDRPGTEDFRWTDNDDYRPAAGLYLSSERAQAERHVALASAHGIDGFTVNWHGIDSYADRNTRLHLAEVLRRHPSFRFSIFYDTSIRFGLDDGRPLPDFTDPRALDAVRRDFDYLARTYFGHPAYQRVADRPLMMIYITRAIPRGVEAITTIARETTFARWGVGPFLIGDEIWWSPSDRLSHHTIALDAVTGYSLAAPEETRSPTTIRPFTERSVALYERLARRIGRRTRIIPTILLRHDDTLFRTPGARIFPTIDALGTARYAEDAAWVLGRMAPLSDAVDDVDLGYLFVTSWNEWPERTAVEPTESGVDRYGLPTPGAEYLRGLRDGRRRLEEAAGSAL